MLLSKGSKKKSAEHLTLDNFTFTPNDAMLIADVCVYKGVLVMIDSFILCLFCFQRR